jgi:hypothetical protein
MMKNRADAEKLREPTLDELLAEPIVRLIMKRDGVSHVDLRGEIERVKHYYAHALEAM